jgi:hypothetical protein
MKKLSRKLSVKRQTLRALSQPDLHGAAAGLRDGAGVCSCHASGCSTFDDSLCCTERTWDPNTVCY